MRFKNICLPVLFLFIALHTKAQLKPITGVHANQKVVQQIKKGSGIYYEAYNLQFGDFVANIGAEDGQHDVDASLYFTGVTFIEEDIDSEYCSYNKLSRAVRRIEKDLDTASGNKYIVVIGNDSTTTLPTGWFDKVILFNSFHHFSKPQVMLNDITRITKNNGTIFLIDRVVKKHGQKSGCKKPRYTKAELSRFVLGAQLIIVKEIKNGNSTLFVIKKLP